MQRILSFPLTNRSFFICNLNPECAFSNPPPPPPCDLCVLTLTESTGSPLTSQVKLAAGRDSLLVHSALKVSPSLYRRFSPVIVGSDFGTSTTCKRFVCIPVMKDGSSAETSQLYDPEFSKDASSSTRCVSFEISSETFRRGSLNCFFAGLSLGAYLKNSRSPLYHLTAYS